MDDKTFEACQLKIRERIKFIHLMHDRNSPQSERSGQIAIQYAAHKLACRYIQEPNWPGHEADDSVRLMWEVQWYLDYVKASGEICQQLQIAVREKRLTLRSQLSRAPASDVSLSAWLNLDIQAEQQKTFEVFWPGVLELTSFGAWPDVVGKPTGAVTIDNLESWMQSESFGMASELFRDPSTDAVQAAPDSETGSRVKWTDEYRADVQAYRDTHGPTKTATHYGVNISLITRETKPKSPKKKAADFTSGLGSRIIKR